MNSPLPLLEHTNDPTNVRSLKRDQLKQLADELREFILESVAQTGGHLSSNLGTVELTVALHHVFNTPDDKIVWDVGHQSYGHKILTGRREQMDTLRQLGGLSGFPKRSESAYDAFGTAHSSTSISAALGMAAAARHLGLTERHHIAVIGDGALTGGMAFEAMNNAGVTENINLLVILNDNDMSISPPVGAMNRYLARLLSGNFVHTARARLKKILQAAPRALEFARRFEEHTKGMIVPATMFEEFGFNYIGPIDGHDLPTLIATLRNMRDLKGPQFLHVVTKKGKGFAPAEADPIGYHAITKLEPLDAPVAAPKVASGPKYSAVFGDWLCDMAAADQRLVGITPAMKEGSDLIKFSERFPLRYFDVAIAEQHAVTFAAGMACEGAKPVVAIYSTFLQRGYDQLVHDVAVQNLDVLFAIDRAGLVGEDGPTHAGSFDLSYLRCIPGMVIMTPSDENELRQMLTTGHLYNGPAAVRYPRGNGPNAAIEKDLEPIEIGKGIVRRQGSKVALLVFGVQLTEALKVAEKLDATVVDMRFVKPLDEELVREIAGSHELLVTIEENAIMGGAGGAVSEFLARENILKSMLHLGLTDVYVEHAKPAQMLAECGLDEAGIEASIRERLELLNK